MEGTDEKKLFNPHVSIIVTTFNNEATIDECLRSILELEYPEQLLDVLVIDGGSTDATVERVKNYPVKLISKSLNAPAAYNLALSMVKGDVVGFIDSDVKVERQWLSKLIKYLDDEKVAGVSGNIETWNKDELLPRIIGYELTSRYSRLPRDVGRVATMNLVLKKEIIENVGGFDEAFSTQYDTEIGTRIAKAGYKIIFEPDATCYHHHRPTLKAYFKQQFNYGQNTSKLYLKYKGLIKGDQITDWFMNIQPIIYLIALIFLIMSILTNFQMLVFAVFLGIILTVVIFYLYHALRIIHRFHDWSAIFLVVVYFTRALAWTMGGLVFILKAIFNFGGIHKD